MRENVKHENPFVLSGYRGPDFFCDRQGETSDIFESIRNGQNITLYARPRMGKTTLVFHVFDTLRRKNQYFDHLYVDLFLTQSLEDLSQSLVTALLKKSGVDHRSWSSKLMDLLRSIGASITFDPVSELPKVELDHNSRKDLIKALHALLNYLEEDRKPWIVVLDEVHQAFRYAGGNMEVLLQELIAKHPRIRFLFVVSDQPGFLEIFAGEGRPLAKNTELIKLEPINSAAYTPFIHEHFSNNGMEISTDAQQFIYSAMRGQTYGVQLLCNRLFSRFDRIGIPEVKTVLDEILAEEQPVFSQINRLITSTQWKLLMAIAGEELVKQPLASDFIKKYDLRSPSTVQTALKALVSKSLVLAGEGYEVQDVFLSRWLKEIAQRR